MRKWFYYAGIIVLLLQATAAYPQIPGARQQPQWAMPFFFEDANGEKDTVWIGYDPEAKPIQSEYDSLYEFFRIKDSNAFQANFFSTAPYPFGSGEDSVKKVEVLSDLTNQIQIGFLNGKMPVTMKWVDSLLYSDSLPFPDISPRPRARVNMICSNGEPGYLYCHLGSLYYAFLLTNYYHPQWSYPHVYADSFVFDGSGNISAEQAISVDIQIVPHNDPIPVGIEDHELMDAPIKINPNPANHFINVTTKIAKPFNLYLIGGDGRLIKAYLNISSSIYGIDLGDQPSGIYIIRVESESLIAHEKFIIK